MQKKILMVAGPNGAGKTTMTQELFTKSRELDDFVNADEIAKGLSPMHPESVAITAGKLMIQRLKTLLNEGKSFAFETTGAGVSYMRHLKFAKSRGYQIHLIFLRLASPDQAIKRVEQRVKHGGHHIPTETIIRRYHAGLRNLTDLYLPFADQAVIMDNASEKSLDRTISSQGERKGILMEDILKAHQRSFTKAFEIAVHTKTALIFEREGELVEIYPPYRYELVSEGICT